MNDFEKLYKELQRFDVNQILKNVWNTPQVQQFIVALNTEGKSSSQLYNLGEDSDGVKLTPPYSFNTVRIKIEKGQRADHVTLKDTGSFYESFEVDGFEFGFEITADTIVDSGLDLEDKYGQKIIGLNEENIQILGEFIAPYFVTEAEKILS